MKKLDYFGREASIPINANSHNLKTCIGAILSIILFLVSFSTLIYAVKISFDLSNQYSNLTEITLQHSGINRTVSTNNTSIMPVFINSVIKDDKNLEFDRILTIKYEYKKFYNNFTSGERKLIESRQVDSLRCKELGISLSTKAAIDQDSIEAKLVDCCGYCPKNYFSSNWTFFGDKNDDYYSQVEVHLYPCNEDINVCEGNLDKIYGQNIAASWSEFYQDFSDKNSPLKPSSIATIYILDPASHNSYDYHFKHNTLKDNFFEIPGYSSVKETTFIDSDNGRQFSHDRDFTSLSCTTKQINEKKCTPYVSIILKSSKNEKIFIRSYLLLWEQISRFGGFIELFSLFSSLVYSVYQLFMNQYHIRSTFGLDQFSKSHGDYLKFIDYSEFQKNTRTMRVIDKIFFERNQMTLIPFLKVNNWEDKKIIVFIRQTKKILNSKPLILNTQMIRINRPQHKSRLALKNNSNAPLFSKSPRYIKRTLRSKFKPDYPLQNEGVNGSQFKLRRKIQKQRIYNKSNMSERKIHN